MSEPDALEVLARDRSAALFGYAYLLTGDPHAAQDLVQDALVRTVARTRTGFRPDDAERYVRAAMLSCFLDGARRRQRWARIRHLLLPPADEFAPAPDRSVGAQLDVRAALATLPPRQRAAVVLRYCEDRTVPDVAAAMGLAVGTVKRYLSDAVRTLEPLLGPLPPVDDEGVPIVVTPLTRSRS